MVSSFGGDGDFLSRLCAKGDWVNFCGKRFLCGSLSGFCSFLGVSWRDWRCDMVLLFTINWSYNSLELMMSCRAAGGGLCLMYAERSVGCVVSSTSIKSWLTLRDSSLAVGKFISSSCYHFYMTSADVSYCSCKAPGGPTKGETTACGSDSGLSSTVSSSVITCFLPRTGVSLISAPVCTRSPACRLSR